MVNGGLVLHLPDGAKCQSCFESLSGPIGLCGTSDEQFTLPILPQSKEGSCHLLAGFLVQSHLVSYNLTPPS